MKYAAAFLLIAAAPAAAQTPWALQSPTPTYWDLRGVAMLSPDRAFVAGRDKVLMETTDAGLTWAQTPTVVRQPLFSEDPFSDVVFGDAQHGYAFSNWNHYRTIDGGATWQLFAAGPANITPSTNGAGHRHYRLLYRCSTIDPCHCLPHPAGQLGLGNLPHLSPAH